MSLWNAVRDCVEDKRRANRRPAYVTSLRQALASLCASVGDVPLSEITSESIRAWASRGSPHYQRTLISRVSTLYSWAIRKRLTDRNPCDEIELITIEKPEPKILTPEQVKTAGDTIAKERPQWLAWFALCAFYGLRPQEACRISWDSIHDETVRVSPAIAKTRRIRIVEPIGNASKWIYEARRVESQLPLSKISSRRCIRLIRDALGLEEWPQDCLRHTAATYALMHFRDAGRTAMWLGNSAPVLLTHYRGLARVGDEADYWCLMPSSMTAQMEFAF